MKEQFIYINSAGNKFYYKDHEMTILHREDGPAIEYANGDKSWYINDKLHREDGPAIEYANGDKSWWINGKRHREDGPAIEYANGGMAWYINGKCHREDGPVVECASGKKEWFITGEELTEEEFNARMNPTVELTIDEIAAKFNVSVDQIKIKK